MAVQNCNFGRNIMWISVITVRKTKKIVSVISEQTKKDQIFSILTVSGINQAPSYVNNMTAFCLTKYG